MLVLALYFLVIIAALTWVIVDSCATSAFEILRRNLHATAREMGMYREWALHSLGRLALLVLLVVLSTAAAFWLVKQNPWEYRPATRVALFGGMLGVSLALFGLPYLAARIRFLAFIYSKSAELSRWVSSLGAEAEVQHHLEPAKYDASHGWTAWHPRGEDWKQGSLWAGLVPAAYLRREKELSVLVPIDWEYFLAWKLPESVLPGIQLPIQGPGGITFLVMEKSRVIGRHGWAVVRADMDDMDLDEVAAV